MLNLKSTSVSFTATYSVEDDKLRLYASERFDQELWEQLKSLGFKWAPSQELIYGYWSPNREDACLALAGHITAEQTTLVERAEAKAGRLDALAAKRAHEATGYARAAQSLAERMNSGQPILLGHHSQRKAQKQKQNLERSKEQAESALSAFDYWHYRAEGVEHHANRKADDGVRFRRIKTLLKELRDNQKNINHGYLVIKLWSKIGEIENEEHRDKFAERYAGAYLKTGKAAPENTYYKLRDKEMTTAEAIEQAIAWGERLANSRGTARYINHYLNRLAYERSELGPVARYRDNITAAILQTFAREQGAFKPKASKNGETWVLTSSVPLPVHLSSDLSLELSVDEWRDLMQSVGYEVPEKKPAKAPILNFKADTLEGMRYGSPQVYRQITLTKEEHKKIIADSRHVATSSCGNFRFKVVSDPHSTQAWYMREQVAVFLSDSKAHKAPESDAINKPLAIKGAA